MTPGLAPYRLCTRSPVCCHSSSGFWLQTSVFFFNIPATTGLAFHARSEYIVHSLLRHTLGNRWVVLLPQFALFALAQPVPDRVTVTRYCLGCHNAKLKSAGLALDAISAQPVPAHADAWEKVIKRLRTRSMPPIGAPRPDEDTYNRITVGLEAALDQAASAKRNPGRTDTFRRLNRTEYRNVIRDLLAVDVDMSSLLPADEESFGFDNITVGDLSPTLLERYLNAAQKISRLAVGGPVKAPGGITINIPPDLTQEEHFDQLPFGTRGGVTVPHTFPLDGEYEFVLRLARDRNEHVEGLKGEHEVELLLDGERVQVFTVKQPREVRDHSTADRHLHVRVPVKGGPHTIAATFLRKRAALPETERQPYQAHFNMDRHPRIQPAVYSVTINGPFDPKGPGETPSRKRIFVCRPAGVAQEAECAQRIVMTLARRAYRRPVAAADIAAPMRFYRGARKTGDFENGVEMALRAVLVSPEFLFRVEQDPAQATPGSAYRISDLELASRLSFFLWSSIPDDELLDAAAAGKLRDAAVLQGQVNRMLADARSKAMVDNFAGQWLYLRNLASITPDMRVFPGFDDNLRRAFRQETELFFESIIREDRSALDLLRANYTFLNERLARHYGIPNITGSRFRRVEFPESSTPPERMRGGLLRHGAILMVTSYATRTSPVLRGKWILSNLLGVPPPPPPNVVPALRENTGTGRSIPFRERMAEHRANPACSGCHQLMDPMGFSLENYDAVGRWRTAEGGTPIDAGGALLDGSRFEGVAGLQKALLSKPEPFLTTFTEKLLTYALGRGADYYDGPAIRSVLHSARQSEYKFSAIIQGIVSSTPFQYRIAQPATNAARK